MSTGGCFQSVTALYNQIPLEYLLCPNEEKTLQTFSRRTPTVWFTWNPSVLIMSCDSACNAADAGNRQEVKAVLNVNTHTVLVCLWWKISSSTPPGQAPLGRRPLNSLPPSWRFRTRLWLFGATPGQLVHGFKLLMANYHPINLSECWAFVNSLHCKKREILHSTVHHHSWGQPPPGRDDGELEARANAAASCVSIDIASLYIVR